MSHTHPPPHSPCCCSAAKELRDQEGPLTPELEAAIKEPPHTVDEVRVESVDGVWGKGREGEGGWHK